MAPMSPSEYQELMQFLREQVAAIGQRFDGMDQRFDATDQRLERIEQRLDGVEQRLDRVEQRIDATDRRLDGMELRFGQRFATMELRFEERLQELRSDMLSHFDQLYGRLERLEGEYHAITAALRRIEALLVDERARREIVERDLATLKENVAVLRARIAEIERRLGAS